VERRLGGGARDGRGTQRGLQASRRGKVKKETGGRHEQKDQKGGEKTRQSFWRGVCCPYVPTTLTKARRNEWLWAEQREPGAVTLTNFRSGTDPSEKDDRKAGGKKTIKNEPGLGLNEVKKEGDTASQSGVL